MNAGVEFLGAESPKVAVEALRSRAADLREAAEHASESQRGLMLQHAGELEQEAESLQRSLGTAPYPPIQVT